MKTPEVPWPTVRLGDAARVFAGSAAPQGLEFFSIKGPPFLRVSDLASLKSLEVLDETRDHLSEKALRELPLIRALKGSVVFPKSGASIGTNRRALLGTDTYLVSHLMAVQPGPQLDSTWLLWWLSQIDMNSLSSNDAYPSLRQSTVANLRIPLPSMEEQRMIVGKLKSVLTEIDRARAAAEARLEAAMALPRSILRSIFSEAPLLARPRKRVSDIGQLLPSRSLSSTGDQTVRTVTTACLTEFGFDEAGIKSARMGSQAAADSRLRTGEILIARSNTPELVGRSALYEGAPRDLVASDLTIRLLPNSEVNPRFLAGYFSYLYASGYWTNRAGGASGSMKKITRTQLLSELCPLPLREEQDLLAEQLSAQLGSAKELLSALVAEAENLSKVPANLLRRAFSGEL